MFTGIITDVGQILAITTLEGGRDERWRIACATPVDNFVIGASICCSGMCLTVVAFGAQGNGSFFDADVSSESLAVTAPRAVGARLNLERAVRPSDELGGHIVSGHVDGLAQVVKVTPEGQGHRVHIKAPNALQHLIAAKGSVTLDGVSLTVNGVDGAVFDVMLVPHTHANTALSHWQSGSAINIEVDMLARYVARQLAFLQPAAAVA